MGSKELLLTFGCVTEAVVLLVDGLGQSEAGFGVLRLFVDDSFALVDCHIKVLIIVKFTKSDV